LQLILFTQANFDHYRPLLGTSIAVKGKLTPQVTAYHETPVMIMVDSIVPSIEPPVKPTASEPSRDDEPRPKVYWASVTVLPTAGRVIKQAWETDPSKFFPKSDGYVTHFFNGPKDVMWVNCGEGYAAV